MVRVPGADLSSRATKEIITIDHVVPRHYTSLGSSTFQARDKGRLLTPATTDSSTNTGPTSVRLKLNLGSLKATSAGLTLAPGDMPAVASGSGSGRKRAGRPPGPTKKVKKDQEGECYSLFFQATDVGGNLKNHQDTQAWLRRLVWLPAEGLDHS